MVLERVLVGLVQVLVPDDLEGVVVDLDGHLHTFALHALLLWLLFSLAEGGGWGTGLGFGFCDRLGRVVGGTAGGQRVGMGWGGYGGIWGGYGGGYGYGYGEDMGPGFGAGWGENGLSYHTLAALGQRARMELTDAAAQIP